MKKTTLFALLVLVNNYCNSQNKKVLFLGNSYTSYSNLPQLLVNVSQSTNDVIVVDSFTPDGFTLQGHNSNGTSLAKINQGIWDFVVLQEQSQLPSFPINQVANQVFPFEQSLNSVIVSQNPCAETVFYMTWGRQNGDNENCSSNPPVCSYTGMDDLLRQSYLTMTNDNAAIVSPVSVVWRYIKTNYPLMNLYDADGSHPSLLGSYVAACCFYTTILRKNPLLITFNSNLLATDADIVKLATKNLVYDNLLAWSVGSYDPISAFSYNNSTTILINFVNNSTNSDQYLWEFGDNITSTQLNPTHSYASAGQYLVKLTSTKCGISKTSQQTINTTTLSENQSLYLENKIKIYPNPVKENVYISALEEIKSIDVYDVYDVYGRLLEHHKKNSTISFIDKNSGVYFLKIQTENAITTKKIIKE